MKKKNKVYIAIDLKSFYASVECVDRGLDPLNVNLVVADSSRTEKTICLAVSPSLKAYGLSGRSRLFEVVQKVEEVNRARRKKAPKHKFTGESYYDSELKENPSLSLGYIVAPPRMAHYMAYSTRIYEIYLKYVAPEDIHVYSIDEVFMDVTDYLSAAEMDAHEFAKTIILDVFKSTGITATAGIAENMYLCKVALDIVSKHITPDENGVRIAELDEMTYRRELWTHRPITDFWRVGHGYAERLAEHGIYTMGDVARCSIGKNTSYYNEDLLYKLFGVNAELLIDHAWGWEPCTIEQVKRYRPEAKSVGLGQVLSMPYTAEKAKLVVSEMVDELFLQLVEKGFVTDQIVITIGYDVENISAKSNYDGEVTVDRFGRKMPKHAHGTANLGEYTSSSIQAKLEVFRLLDEILNKNLTIRRIYITAAHVITEASAAELLRKQVVQLDIFGDSLAEEERNEANRAVRQKEKNMQQAVIGIKKKFGKNAIVKGVSLEEGATAIERNGRIGGHKA